MYGGNRIKCGVVKGHMLSSHRAEKKRHYLHVQNVPTEII